MEKSMLSFIRFYPEVEITGNIENVDVLRQNLMSLAESASAPFLSAHIEEQVQAFDMEELKDILCSLAYQKFLDTMWPTFKVALRHYRDHPFLGIIRREDFTLAYLSAQKLVDDLLAREKALIDHVGTLQVQDTDLKRTAYDFMGRLKSEIDTSTAFEHHSVGASFDDRGRRAGQLLVYLLESFRHPLLWKGLSDEETKALRPPCLAAARRWLGKGSHRFVSGRIPWPFAFIAWSLQNYHQFPAWLTD